MDKEKLEALEKKIEELEKKVQKYQDYMDIVNLMGRYQYLLTGGQNAVIARELYAYDHPDARCEYGPLGVFTGDRALEFFEQVDYNFCLGRKDGTADGTLEYHQITTPVIEIAEDGKTAKGMWLSTGAILMAQDPEDPEGSFTWDVGKYAVDFIKTDKGWKIWHLHVCDLWRSDFSEDPVKNRKPPQQWTTREMIDEYNARAERGEKVRPHGFPIPDRPTTFHYFYSGELPASREPRPPEPYDTFENTFSY